jgi:hypothetical protein
MYTADYDEDAELQARSWNQFVRNVPAEEKEINFANAGSIQAVVTYSDIMASKVQTSASVKTPETQIDSLINS